MSQEQSGKIRKGYCIFIDTFFQGPVPILSDGEGRYIIFDTKLEAQREIADYMITRLGQFLEGERDFEDAITVEEYVVPVSVDADGTIWDEAGNSFPSHES